MPYIKIKMFPGRSDEVKKELAEKIRQCAAETMGADIAHFSVGIEDVAADEWNEKVADQEPAEGIYAGEMYFVK